MHEKSVFFFVIDVICHGKGLNFDKKAGLLTGYTPSSKPSLSFGVGETPSRLHHLTDLQPSS
jgi:hypothetical protein